MSMYAMLCYALLYYPSILYRTICQCSTTGNVSKLFVGRKMWLEVLKMVILSSVVIICTTRLLGSFPVTVQKSTAQLMPTYE